jgi:hypothetical protein
MLVLLTSESQVDVARMVLLGVKGRTHEGASALFERATTGGKPLRVIALRICSSGPVPPA